MQGLRYRQWWSLFIRCGISKKRFKTRKFQSLKMDMHMPVSWCQESTHQELQRLFLCVYGCALLKLPCFEHSFFALIYKDLPSIGRELLVMNTAYLLTLWVWSSSDTTGYLSAMRTSDFKPLILHHHAFCHIVWASKRSGASCLSKIFASEAFRRPSSQMQNPAGRGPQASLQAPRPRAVPAFSHFGLSLFQAFSWPIFFSVPGFLEFVFYMIFKDLIFIDF